jgi:para-nitrobenzyl esterase
VIETFRQANPQASPWDLWILIATDHPRGTYSRELAKRKADQRGAPVFAYRYDWETPEGGGHMRSPHTIEIQFVFNNIKIAGPLISKMPEAYALAEKTSAAWAAFARTGNPNTSRLPAWPAYSAAFTRHDALQQRMPRRARPGSRSTSGDGAGTEAYVTYFLFRP